MGDWLGIPNCQWCLVIVIHAQDVPARSVHIDDGAAGLAAQELVRDVVFSYRSISVSMMTRFHFSADTTQIHEYRRQINECAFMDLKCQTYDEFLCNHYGLTKEWKSYA